jgi:hypothetical protein
VTLVEVAEAVSVLPAPTVAVAVAVQPLASVTVAVTAPGHRLIAVDVVCEAGSFQLNVNGKVPPEGTTETSPSQLPKHCSSITIAMLRVIAAGSLIVTVWVETHPLASVTSNENVPAQSPDAVAVVCAAGSFQRNEKGAVPPVRVAVAVASQAPLQLIGVELMARTAAPMSFTTTETGTEHPLAAVTVTL